MVAGSNLSTKPETLRPCNIQVGTKIGLIGDYNAPSTWSHGKLVLGSLSTYVVIERDILAPSFDMEHWWDTAAIMTLSVPLQTVDFADNHLTVDTLLLLQRFTMTKVKGCTFDERYYPPWEYDITVLVYGLKTDEGVNYKGLTLDYWKPIVSQLSGAAVLTEEETPSFYTQLREIREEIIEVNQRFEQNLMTKIEYEERRKKLQDRFDTIAAQYKPSCYIGE